MLIATISVAFGAAHLGTPFSRLAFCRRCVERNRLRHNRRSGVGIFRRDSSFASCAVSIILLAGKHVPFERSAVSVPAIFIRLGPWKLLLFVARVLGAPAAFAQGGPPYYTNDPGTPGNHSWEINLGYMPFLYTNQSITHMPDVDINFGLGDLIQLTFENAWLRVVNPSSTPKYGLGQDQLGVKWRFYENEESGFAISVFPQLSVNNPDDSVARGITPRSASLIIPVEFSKKLGPIDLNWEVGYNYVHTGASGWLAGVVVGRDLSKNLEVDAEFYGLGTYHPANGQQTIEGGLRYKIHPPFILLLMAGRSVQPSSNEQPHFVGYFGLQFLLPPKPFAKD
jgi:hypothetical protein